MSNSYEPPSQPQLPGQQAPSPVRYPAPPPQRVRLSLLESILVGTRILVALATVVFLAVLIAVFGQFLIHMGAGSAEIPLTEHSYAGKTSSAGKVAVVRIDGIIMEGTLGYANKQIRDAGTDNSVKAVVIRVDSPGGSISASDDLHRRITELRTGNSEKKIEAKHVVVSMGGLAASGGYYISMPAETVFAERTTLTGSIGVIGTFPNIKELGDNYGFHMDVVKSGPVKDSGSPFREMTPEDRELFQQMIDHAYKGFLKIVEDGRKDSDGKTKLKEPLDKVIVDKKIEDRSPEGKAKSGEVQYKRYLADGGVWSADDALKYGLIDKIGYLDDAITEAKSLAKLPKDSNVITYERPPTYLWGLTDGETMRPGLQITPAQLANSATPRMWYLAPQAELAGFLASMER